MPVSSSLRFDNARPEKSDLVCYECPVAVQARHGATLKVSMPDTGRPVVVQVHSGWPLRTNQKASRNQAARNDSPPPGVTAPNAFAPVNASTYRLPENKTMPARSREHTHVPADCEI